MADEYIRKEWNGGTVQTTLTAGITAGALAATLTDGTTFPTGTDPFVIVIDRGASTEEKILVDSRSGSTLSFAQRGYDGSAASAHAAGATVNVCLDAYTIEQANAMATTMRAVGDLIYKSVIGDNASFAALAIGAAGRVLLSNGTVPGWGQVGTSGIADGAVTADKIGTDAVGSDEIAAGAVGTTELAAGAVTAAKVDSAYTSARDAYADAAAAAVQTNILNGETFTGTMVMNGVIDLSSGSLYDNGETPLLLVIEGEASAASDLDSTTSPVDFLDTGNLHEPRAGDVAKITATVDIRNDVAVSALAQLLVMSPASPSGTLHAKQIIFRGDAGERATLTRTWRIPITDTGTHRFKVQVSTFTGSAGDAFFEADHSVIQWDIYR